MQLNPAQRAGVEHRGTPLLVLAGAGTGKTRVITHRVAKLLDEGIPTWRILAVTFTNKAAAEMRSRIEQLCEGRHEVRKMWIGTFHSVCARILRQYGQPLGLSARFTIYDSADQQSLMSRVLQQLGVSDRLYTPRGVLVHVDRAKNRGLGPDQLDELGLLAPVRSVVADAYRIYQQKLLQADAADFGDLIVLAVKLLRDATRPAPGQLGDTDPVRGLLNRFLHVVVDEFQDTNPIQAELVDLLSRRAELCVVGDDDQAIYGWRGADVEQILNFPDRHDRTEIVRLEQNYRSTGCILRCADAIIRRNTGRLGKTLWTDAGDGEAVRLVALHTERDEARLVASEIRASIDEGDSPEDFAVFYRTHAQSRVVEDELRRFGLGCRIVGGVAFYERAEIKDVLSYLVVLHNPHSDPHLSRIINRPTRGIGQTSESKLAEHAAAKGTSLWTAAGEPDHAGLGKAASKRVRAFVDTIQALRKSTEGVRLDDMIVAVLDETGYREALLADGDEEAQSRLENLQELLGNVTEFVDQEPEAALAEYLERVSLAGAERAEGDHGGAVTLMTVHSAKGLEFEHVYLTGMEERVFPHARVLEDPIALEEERRLAYVAVTRARRRLTITLVAQRRLFGQIQVGTPSRFVLELPRDAIEMVGEPQRRLERATWAKPQPRPASWNDDVVYDDAASSPFVDDGGADGDVGEGVALYVGMTVRHRQFGDGELIGWQGTGKNLKLHLRFREHGTKTILARFCEPL